MFCENFMESETCGEGCKSCAYNYNETTIEAGSLP